jgi:hypothetical protein
MDKTDCPKCEAPAVKTWDVDSSGRSVHVYVCRTCPWELTKPAQ